MSTSIEWTATVNADGSVTPGKTWNPVTGCTKVSAGCKHCYAETIADRFWKTQYPPIRTVAPNRVGTLIAEERPRVFTDVQTHEDRLTEPLRWRKPAKVFVNSMSDLFHEDVSFEFIKRVWDVMATAQRHTFQVLTKRPERMREFTQWMAGADDISIACWPRNVWLGTSCENQETADERIPLLLQTPSAVRWVSAEPLLGPVDLRDIQPMRGKTHTQEGLQPLIHFPEWNALNGEMVRDRMGFDGPRLDWVVVGGESGPGARPCEVAWIRAIQQQCRVAGVACFIKQLGSDPRDAAAARDDMGAREQWPAGWMPTIDGRRVWRPDLTDRKGGDLTEWPRDLQVRQWPRVE